MEEMSKFCFSRTTTTTTTATSSTTITTTSTTTTTTITHFSTLLLSDFLFFSSYIFSHPLYFSYFIFFSPYLLKLLSFLSPLFITTSLLLLALLTVSPNLINLEFSESKAGFLLNTYNTIINTLRSKLDNQSMEKFQLFEELEACIELVQEYPDEVSPTKYSKGTHVIKFSSTTPDFIDVSEELPYNIEENSPYELLQVRDIAWEELSDQEVEEKYIDSTGMETGKDIGENQDKPFIGKGSEVGIIEDCYHSKETKNSKKFDLELEGHALTSKEDPIVPIEVCRSDNGGEYISNVVMENPKKLDSNANVHGSIRKEYLVPNGVNYDNGGEYPSKMRLGSNLGVCGSMRKEKEWKRTLAGKLYEERQTVDGSEEGMDSLWESYDTDLCKMKIKKKEKKVVKKTEIENHNDDDDDDDEDEKMDGPICCLQALKLSTGKMNLGMRKPNLMRISKALKGIGWFHQVSRHGKKG